MHETTQDEAVPFSQLKSDWKATELWLNGTAMPFSYHLVDWMALVLVKVKEIEFELITILEHIKIKCLIWEQYNF